MRVSECESDSRERFGLDDGGAALFFGGVVFLLLSPPYLQAGGDAVLRNPSSAPPPLLLVLLPPISPPCFLLAHFFFIFPPPSPGPPLFSFLLFDDIGEEVGSISCLICAFLVGKSPEAWDPPSQDHVGLVRVFGSSAAEKR